MIIQGDAFKKFKRNVNSNQIVFKLFLVFIHKEDLEVIKEDDDGMGEGGKVENLLEICFQRNNLMRDLVVRHIKVVADLWRTQ